MKKILLILLITALILCIVGCREADAETELKFEKTYYGDGGGVYTAVIVDPETGVNYLFHKGGYGGGMTPRYNADGTLYVSEVE